LTPQILAAFLQPNEANLARNSYVYRDGTTLRLLGDHWTASGANVYWLGLDENVIPPAGQPFYAPLNASYPTKGRTSEIMETLVTMGAKLIRSQTLGVSVGNPLSVMPTLGVYNEQAFQTIDWAVWQARQHGLRIIAPLTDNYVSLLLVLRESKIEELTEIGLLPWREVRLPAFRRLQYHRQRITPLTRDNAILHEC
jgi:mannan endo-1,4-beta-mannosidase